MRVSLSKLAVSILIILVSFNSFKCHKYWMSVKLCWITTQFLNLCRATRPKWECQYWNWKPVGIDNVGKFYRGSWWWFVPVWQSIWSRWLWFWCFDNRCMKTHDHDGIIINNWQKYVIETTWLFIFCMYLYFTVCCGWWKMIYFSFLLTFLLN